MVITLRNVCGWLLAKLFISCGLVRRAKEKAMRGDYILPIYFHKPSKREFASCVAWLIQHKFTLISISDIDNIIQHRLPFPKGAALITVDDGWSSNEENIVEVANKLKVPVTIFVSTGPVEEGAYWWSYVRAAKKSNIQCPSINTLKQMPNKERLVEVAKLKKKVSLRREAMTIEQVRKAASSKFVTIGSHTDTHPILINCKKKQIYSELEVSRSKLEAWTGKRIDFFAYPNGDYSKREIKALQELNYRLAFCSDQKPLTPECLKNVYNLPRVAFLEGASLAENICRITGVWKPLTLKLKFSFPKKHTAAFKPALKDTKVKEVKV